MNSKENMNEKEKIIDKIKKLLALHQNNSSEEESYAALKKAQEMMAEYKLVSSDVEDKKKVECVRCQTKLSYTSRSSDSYIALLSDVIADNFACVSFTSRYYREQSRYVVFMGESEDVLLAEEVLYAANAAVIRGYNKVYHSLCRECDYLPARIFNKYKEGYCRGYIAGLKSALERQKEEHQEWGLVLVAPQEAQEYVGGLGCAYHQEKVVNKSFYNDGYNDGSNFTLNKKLDAHDTVQIGD